MLESMALTEPIFRLQTRGTILILGIMTGARNAARDRIMVSPRSHLSENVLRVGYPMEDSVREVANAVNESEKGPESVESS